MRKFYEKVLPSQGVYCVTGINKNDITKNKFAETLDDFLDLIENFKNDDQNVFFNPASLVGHSRKNDGVLALRSFYIDLDVGEGKGYSDQEVAYNALIEFIENTGIPDPVILSSGRGIHAYWIFNEDIPVADWKPYAEKFKDFCMNEGLQIDPVVTAHQARIMRCPNTFNYKVDPPVPTGIITDTIHTYDFKDFKDQLGEIEPSIEEFLMAIPKGMDEDTAAFGKNKENFETLFSRIAIKSLEGEGCNQIRHMLMHPNDVEYSQWAGGLTLAVRCDDGSEAIHKLSEDCKTYNYEATEKKAYNDGLEGPRSCSWFMQNYPKQCEGCKHVGKFKNPLPLGRELRIAQQPDKPEEQAYEEDFSGAVRQEKGLKALPIELKPYVMAQGGGIYFMQAGKVDKQTGLVGSDEPVKVSTHNVYPIGRIYSPVDGETLVVRVELPHDPVREFMLPLKNVYASEKFKDVMASNGVMFPAGNNGAALLMNYFVKWEDYMINKSSAEIMRMQMGWTENRDAFVVGKKEIRKSGETVVSPTSPLCREAAKHLGEAGTFELWQTSANKLNMEGLEVHAFTMLAGFGSTLMCHTTTSGGTISLAGESGAAKTGAMYAQLSAWGNPKDISAADGMATANGLVGRYLALRNIPFGLDETTNMEALALSKLIHSISHGKAKIRMQSSVNAEREHEASASLIATMTTNHSMYDKLMSIKKNPNGEVARMIEFFFNDIPKPISDNPSLAPEIFEPFNHNYGHAGPMFIRAVFTYSDEEIRERILKWGKRFKKDFGDNSAYRFYESMIGAVLTAGEICNEHGIVTIDLERVYAVIIRIMNSIRLGIGKINDVDHESLVGDFLNQNQSSILSIKNGNVVMEPRGPLIIRSVVDEDRLYISRPAFHKYLADNQVSRTNFSDIMTKMGALLDEKKTRMGAGWKDATSEVNVVCYVFDTSKFSKPVDEVVAKVAAKA